MKFLLLLTLSILSHQAFSDNCLRPTEINISSLGGQENLIKYSRYLALYFERFYEVSLDDSDGFGMDMLRHRFYSQKTPISINVHYNEGTCIKKNNWCHRFNSI